MRFKKVKGNVALSTVILIFGLLLLSGITLMNLGIDLTRQTSNYTNRTMAKMNSLSCIEETLLQLKMNRSLTGEIAFTNPSGQCRSTIANGASVNLKAISLVSTYLENNYEANFTVDISQNPFELTEL